MSVMRVSFVLNLTFNAAMAIPMMPLDIIAAIHMRNTVTKFGIPVLLNAMTDAVIAPIRNSPSPPIFQKRILKERLNASDVIRSGTNILRKPSILLYPYLFPTRPIVNILP